MKKLTLAIIASTALVLAAPASGGNMAEQSSVAMKKGMNSGSGCKSKCMKKGMGQGCKAKKSGGKMSKGKMNSPFLINHGLPKLGMMIAMHMDDPSFALSGEQKAKLKDVRSETMGTVQKIMPQVASLKKEIVAASLSGTNSDALKAKVDKLAQLEADATMAQIKCIEKTKAILTKDQLVYILALKANKSMRQNMKCASKKKNMKMGK